MCTWQTSALRAAAERWLGSLLPCDCRSSRTPGGFHRHALACPSFLPGLCRCSSCLAVPPGHVAPHLQTHLAVIEAQCVPVGGRPCLSVPLCSPAWKSTRPAPTQNRHRNLPRGLCFCSPTVSLLTQGRVLWGVVLEWRLACCFRALCPRGGVV